MKILKLIAFAAVTALPLQAAAMCGGDYMHETTTASVCDAGMAWDDTTQQCIETVG